MPESSFPHYADILPRQTPAYRYGINPAYLETLAGMAKAFTAEGTAVVALEFYGPHRPMVMRAQMAERRFTGVAMGLNLEGEALAAEADYRQREQKINTMDMAYATLLALREYAQGLGPDAPEPLCTIAAKGDEALLLAGLIHTNSETPA